MTDLSISEQSEKEQTRIQSLAFLLSILICAAAAVYVAFLCEHNAGRAQIVLDDKINPNVETAASIMRLPSLGAVKAKAIVEYRQSVHQFTSAGDLDNVKGIGPKTVEKLRPYLKFE